MPTTVGAQGRDGVYERLAVTEAIANAFRVAGGIVAGTGSVQVVKADGGMSADLDRGTLDNGGAGRSWWTIARNADALEPGGNRR